MSRRSGVFLTRPVLTWTGGRYPWRLTEDLLYLSPRVGQVIIPAGYTTDFASVPRLPLVYMTLGGRASLAAVVHDYLYDCPPDGVSRADADAVFLEAMKAAGEPGWLARQSMYAGVRLGGWRAWRRDTSDKCP